MSDTCTSCGGRAGYFKRVETDIKTGDKSVKLFCTLCKIMQKDITRVSGHIQHNNNVRISVSASSKEELESILLKIKEAI